MYINMMSHCFSQSTSVSQTIDNKTSSKCPSKEFTSDFPKSDLQFCSSIYPPNIQHELNVAQATLQQGSLVTGNSLFDHLAEIIKLIINEQPTNIVDYFEELSFNLRLQKFKIPENFPWTYFEPIDISKAQSILNLMNLPLQSKDSKYQVCIKNPSRQSRKQSRSVPVVDHPNEKLQRNLFFNENVQQLNLYWALCGFDLLEDEVFHLSYALQKIQRHQTINHARFWGKFYGLKKSYYIAEALLTQSEIDIRVDKMRDEMIKKISSYQERKFYRQVNEDTNLIPGVQWQDLSLNELEKFQHQCKSVPSLKTNRLEFDTPPEHIGTGLNRRTYFVLNNLDEEWTELPYVDPQQIKASRKIKKFLTGDLNSHVDTYPNFPGNEKHYLRAIISRITSGTYIAPNGYYRKLSKDELFLNNNNEETNDPEQYESNGEEDGEVEEFGNDVLITENAEYKPNIENQQFLRSWAHFRPNILEQGRIVYFDEEKAIQALEKGSSLIFSGTIENEQTLTETDNGEDLSDVEEDDLENNPALFSTCDLDKSTELLQNWSIRPASRHNKINQITILRSNLWPGAYSLACDNYSDSVYFGFGFKYTTRNMGVEQIPPIHTENESTGQNELCDPTVEMEEAWRKLHGAVIFEEISEEEYFEEEEVSC